MVIFAWLLGNSAERRCVIDANLDKNILTQEVSDEYEIQERLLPVLSKLKQSCKEVIE